MRPVDMATVRCKYLSTNPDGHWFDRDSMRFFRTLLPRTAYESETREMYFVTRETNPSGETRWSVRRLTQDAAEIETVGDFHSYVTRQRAVRAAKAYASGAACTA